MMVEQPDMYRQALHRLIFTAQQVGHPTKPCAVRSLRDQGSIFTHAHPRLPWLGLRTWSFLEDG